MPSKNKIESRRAKKLEKEIKLLYSGADGISNEIRIVVDQNLKDKTVRIGDRILRLKLVLKK